MLQAVPGSCVLLQRGRAAVQVEMNGSWAEGIASKLLGNRQTEQVTFKCCYSCAPPPALAARGIAEQMLLNL